MDGFLVQQPFADLIASGEKTLEIRTQPVHLPTRAEFYILATNRAHGIAPNYDTARLGMAVGIATYHGTEGPFTVEDLLDRQNEHRVEPDALAAYAKGRRLYAMKVHGRPIEPRPYVSKPGAVTIITNVELR